MIWPDAAHKLFVCDISSAAGRHVAALDEFNCVGSFDSAANAVGKMSKFIR